MQKTAKPNPEEIEGDLGDEIPIDLENRNTKEVLEKEEDQEEDNLSDSSLVMNLLFYGLKIYVFIYQSNNNREMFRK